MRTTQLAAGAVVLGLATALATPVLGAAMAGDQASQPSVSAGDSARTSTSVALASLASVSVESPTADVLFNEPTGVRAAQDRITKHIRRAIDDTPHHGMIRMAAYSFDRR